MVQTLGKYWFEIVELPPDEVGNDLPASNAKAAQDHTR